MNNSYDRGAGEGPRYTDVFFQERPRKHDRKPSEAIASVRAVRPLLQNAYLSMGAYALYDPRVIQIAAAAPTEDGLGTQTTVNYSDWMPLAEGREFTLSERYVVLVTDPIPNLIESYARARTNG